EWGLGAAPDWHREFHKSFIETSYDADSHAVMATKRLWEVPAERGHWNADWPFVAFHSCSKRPSSFDTDKESVLGMYGSVAMPEAVRRGRLGRRAGNWLDPVGSLQIDVTLKAGASATLVFTLGAADSREQANDLAIKYRSVRNVRDAFDAVRQRWDRMLTTVRVETPDPALNVMVNTWLKYQAISGRLWGRTAYYQTGGAYGFRDQLQDSQVFLPIDADVTRRQILLHARHQFRNGSVYHWWHPISELGLRNAISDNLLWLPFVVNSFVQETGDLGIFDLREPFVDDPAPMSLYEHCTRAIEYSLDRFSKRGLPLIGGGDWNDGLNAVGLDMKGESVWLGHFLHGVLNEFSSLARRRGDDARSSLYRDRAEALRSALNTHAWDGQWYFRATKDDGARIGSSENSQGRVFLNAQTWAVITGVADPSRAEQVLDVVERELETKVGPVLLRPAYTTPDATIGYLSRYAAGMRENGGVYTHAATWAVMAAARLKRSEAAYRMARKINPVVRGEDPEEYVAEPYVMPGNIEGPDSACYGRGGWTWYTGSAAWYFKVLLEWILGIRPTVDGLTVDPCIPADWKSFSAVRVFRGATYRFEIRNPGLTGHGVADIQVNGAALPLPTDRATPVLPVMPEGSQNDVIVTLRKNDGMERSTS
ncbi:MAG: glycosyltransferase 36, partial [Bacteroidetes bacterium]|nr:glycosyltransferase 36 [Bacteroidota bacterium]